MGVDEGDLQVDYSIDVDVVLEDCLIPGNYCYMYLNNSYFRTIQQYGLGSTAKMLLLSSH